jgi:hypothetical protein
MKKVFLRADRKAKQEIGFQDYGSATIAKGETMETFQDDHEFGAWKTKHWNGGSLPFHDCSPTSWNNRHGWKRQC